MTTKRCGTCEFWDRDKAILSPRFSNRKIAECRFPLPFSFRKAVVIEDEGQDCAVYK